MPLPAITDTARDYLFADYDKMVRDGVPKVTASRIMRLREAYTFWRDHPSKKDREIVARLMESGGIARSQAYEDLAVVKQLLGSTLKSSKDYHMYRFLSMIQRAYEKSEAKGDVAAMVAAADKYAKYARLDKEDERLDLYSMIPVQVFKITDNPEVIGFKRVPGIREKIEAKKRQYMTEDIMDVSYEDVDTDLDAIFHPADGEDAAGLPQ